MAVNICPNINSPEWKALEMAVGRFEAMKDFMENEGIIRTPEQVSKKIESRNSLAAMRIVELKKTNTDIEQRLLNSGAIKRKNDILFVLKHRYPDAINIAARINKELGPGTVKIVPVASKKGEGGRTIYKAIVAEPGEQFVAFEKDATPDFFFMDPSTPDEPTKIDTTHTERTESKETINKFAQTISNSINTPYKFISSNEAIELTSKASNKWSGEKAFFFGDTVYFVGDSFTKDTVFHEFSHPLIRAIRKNNPVLFNNLYSKVADTSEGEQIINLVKDRYKDDFSQDSDYFKEEVLVRSMQQHFRDMLDAKKGSPGFVKAIQNFIYQIRQLIRKIFGSKIKAENLNVGTTITELADMLAEGTKFDLDTHMVNEDDVVAYAREQQEELETLKSLEKGDIAVITKDFYDTVLNHLRKLRQGKNYGAMADILANEFEPTELAKIRQNLSLFQQDIQDKMDKLINNVTYSANLSEATVNSFYHLSGMTTKMEAHLDELRKNPNDKDGLQQMAYYQGLINDWRNFTAETKDALDKQGISTDNKLYKLVSKIQSDLERSTDYITNIRKRLVKDVVWSHLTGLAEYINEQHEKGFLSDKAYEDLKLTPEKIGFLLEGKLGDAHQLNSFIEGYMYSQDPIVAAAAKFINDNYADVITTAQSKLNDFANNIQNDLRAVGYDQTRPDSLGKILTFVDTIGYTDDKGVFQTKKVFSFLNEHKDYRSGLAKLQHDIMEAEKLPRTEQNKKEIRRLRYVLDNHKRLYFNQEYHPDYYKAFALFQDEIGQEAWDDYQVVSQDAQSFRDGVMSGYTESEIENANKAIRRKFQNLYSLTNEDGSPKLERERIKAQKLIDFRRHMGRFTERKVYIKSFRAALSAYEQYLKDNGYVGEEFDKARKAWIMRNTDEKVKPEYREEVNKALATIRRITKGASPAGDLYQELYDKTARFRDDNYQLNGQEVPAEVVDEIKKLEDKIEEDRKSGAYNHLSQLEKLDLFNQFDKLRQLKMKVPTDYYISTFNAFLEKMDLADLQKAVGTTELNRENADLILKDLPLLKSLFEQNKEFEEWFVKNHRVVYTKANGEFSGYAYERLYIWNTTRPKNKEYYESTVIAVDAEGKPTETIDRVPSFRFTYTTKKEYFTDDQGNKALVRTKKVVGQTIDNKGNWLPKTMEQGAPADSPYINRDYLRLKNAPAGTQDAKLYTLLEKIKAFHIENQKGLGRNAKLYYDAPRFEKENWEALRSKTTKGIFQNPLTVFSKQLKMWIAKAKDDAQKGFNWEADMEIAKSDTFDEEMSSAKIPIYGTPLIDPEVTSLDIFAGVTRYMLSAEMNKKKQEMAPTLKAIEAVLGHPDNAIKEIMKVSEGHQKNRGVITYKNKKGKNVRLQTIINLREREIDGQTMTGFGKDVKWLNQISSFLMHRASFGFFALNAPSAIKNSLAAHMEIMIESAGGTYITPATYGTGVAWASKVMTEISAQIYKIGPKSLNVQMTEIFDPTRGRQEEKFGNSLSRSLAKDVVDFSWLYNFRKWTEMHATMSLFGGMMTKQKVKRTVDGVTVDINYLDAWEIGDDGKIRLKEGVDPEWGVEGKNFKEFREKINTVSKRLQGAYSRFDQPEAQRYLLFRMIWFLRRFFMPMLMDRWAFRGNILSPKPRYDVGSGELTQGYYVTSLQLLLQTVMSGKNGLPSMGPRQKRAVIKMSTEILSLMALGFLYQILFDYDPDDEDRLKKLRAKSGSMPVWGLAEEDPNNPFHIDGWLSNHMLNILMMTKAENDQWLPVPGLGLDNYVNTLNLKSFAYGPTIEAYVNMANDIRLITAGDARGYYKKDVGPYKWQKEGSAKLINHVAKTVGLTGTTLDPVLLTKNTEWLQQPTRR